MVVGDLPDEVRPREAPFEDRFEIGTHAREVLFAQRLDVVRLVDERIVALLLDLQEKFGQVSVTNREREELFGLAVAEGGDT